MHFNFKINIKEGVLCQNSKIGLRVIVIKNLLNFIILDIEKSDKYDKKIGFYISYVLRDRYSNKVRYVINAAISQNDQLPNCNSTIYEAEIRIDYDNGAAWLSDNTVKENFQNQGIGSLGLNYIKDFCKSQGCKCITGKKQPVPNTKEELDKLTHFYDKNRFEQFSNNQIKFNL